MTDTLYILIRLVVIWAYTFINTQIGHLDICNSLHVKFPSIKRCDYLLPSLIGRVWGGRRVQDGEHRYTCGRFMIFSEGFILEDTRPLSVVCLSLMPYDVELFFICLSAIHLSSFVLSKSSAHLGSLFMFLLLIHRIF